MAVIDADAHVVETHHTWEHLEPSDHKYRPATVKNEQTGEEFTVIDGKLLPGGGNEQVFTAERALQLGIPLERKITVSQGAFAMENVQARITDMDGFGTDIQVLQPTMFLRAYSDRVATQVALCGAYARWMANITKDHRDRLRWAAPLPLLSIPDSIDLLRFAHENGAVSVFIRPFELNRPIYDPYFDPLYEEVTSLNMAVGVHVGNGNSEFTDYLRQYVGFGRGFLPFVFPTAGAFHGVISSGLPLRHPKLRIGFLEASASWLPWVLNDLRRRAEAMEFPEKLLKEYRLFVSCFTTDDIHYLTQDPFIGEDNLVIGTDYGHSDVGTEVEAMKNLKAKGDVPPGIAKKILEDTPATLYAL